MEYKIRFNVPPFVGKETEYIMQAVKNEKICGDGEFTKKDNAWLEEKTGAAKALLTTSCTHALEMAAILCDIKEGDEVMTTAGILGSITQVKGDRVLIKTGDSKLEFHKNFIQTKLISQKK